MNHALIVEDDEDTAQTMAALIGSEHFTVATANSLRDARRQLALQVPDVVLLDLQLPDGSGMELFKDAALLQQSEVVLITGHASLETSIQALRLGATDYLQKPINLKQLNAILSRVMRPAALRAELATLEAQLQQGGHFGALWGRSTAMRRVYQQIARVAGTSITVFITGESGTGKELVAQTTHALSRRRRQPFLAVNCGAISPHLIESEIFGHEKGSFTGAERQHLGFFERARGGTLFLDEVTEMPPDLQVKLLRVLESGSFSRVGSTEAIQADVRVIAATNRVPEDAVAQGKLREDLMYRLNVFPIAVPPLRDRVEDIPLLADHFLRAIGTTEGRTKRWATGALEHLTRCPWPGNVRQLRNGVQRAYVMAPGDTVTAEWLPPTDPNAPLLPYRGTLGEPTDDEGYQWSGPERLPLSAVSAVASLPFAAPGAAATLHDGPALRLPIGISLEEAERQLILATLAHFDNHKERTAAALGVSLKTLYNRLKLYRGEATSE